MISKFFILFIRIYQALISPFLNRRCRFHPTCSSYSLQCFQNFPAHLALWYSLLRILKCHPFHRGGYDPVNSNR